MRVLSNKNARRSLARGWAQQAMTKRETDPEAVNVRSIAGSTAQEPGQIEEFVAYRRDDLEGKQALRSSTRSFLFPYRGGDGRPLRQLARRIWRDW